MAANMTAINFTATNRHMIVQNVFDALKMHKEQSKLDLLTQALEEEVNVAIVET
jgi:RNA-splicing ligase RtcB